MKKKILSLLLCMAMLVGFLPASTYAAGELAVTVESKSARVGETVTLNVTAANFPDNVGAFNIGVRYDESAFSDMKIISEDADENTFIGNASVTAGSSVIGGNSSNGTKALKLGANNLLFQIQLTVKSDIYNGNYDVELVAGGSPTPTLYFSDLSDNPIATTWNKGTVTVTGGKTATLTSVSLFDTKGGTATTDKATTWPTGIPVTFTGDSYVVYAKAFSEETPSGVLDLTASTTWTAASGITAVKEDGYVKITIPKTASVGTYTVTAENGGTTKTLSFTVSHADADANELKLAVGENDLTNGFLYIPTDATSSVANFTLTAKDQYGDDYNLTSKGKTVTWVVTPSEEVTGITFPNGSAATSTLSVGQNAKNGIAAGVTKTYTVKATVVGYNSATVTSNEVTVKVARATAKAATMGDITGGTGTVSAPKSGDAKTVKYNVNVEDQYGTAMSNDVTWSIDSKDSKVTINSTTGVLSVGVGAGTNKTYTITATSKTNSSLRRITTVKIIGLPAPTVTFNPTPSAKATYGDTGLSATASITSESTGELAGYTKQAIKYSSSNTNVATIDEANGTITIKGVGETTIKATAPVLAEQQTQFAEGEASYTLTVSAKELSSTNFELTGLNATKTFDNTKTVTVTGVTVKGLVGTDALTVATGDYTVEYENENVGADKTITVTIKALTGEKKNNYTVPAAWTLDDKGEITAANRELKLYESDGTTVVSPITLNPGEAKTYKFTYNDLDKTGFAALKAGLSIGSEVSYTLTETATGKATLTLSARKTGTTTLGYKMAATTNYNAVAEATVNVTSNADFITKITPKPADLSATLDGTTIKLVGFVDSGVTPEATVQYIDAEGATQTTSALGDKGTFTAGNGKTYTIDTSGVEVKDSKVTIEAEAEVTGGTVSGINYGDDNTAVVISGGNSSMNDGATADAEPGITNTAKTEIKKALDGVTSSGNLTVDLKVAVGAPSGYKDSTAAVGSRALEFSIDVTLDVKDEHNAKLVEGHKVEKLDSPLTFTVKIPDGFKPTVAKHTHGNVTEWLGVSVNLSAKTASWKMDTFSPVELIEDNRTATITYNMPDGTTKTVTYDASDIGKALLPEIDGKKVTITTANGATIDNKLTEELLNGDDFVATAGYTTDNNGGNYPYYGGWTYTGSTDSKPVTLSANVSNGKVTLSNSSAVPGTTVTINVKPNEGYELTKLTVTDADGNSVTVTEKNGVYTFVMPKTAVTVTPTFSKKTVEDTKPVITRTEIPASGTAYANTQVIELDGEKVEIPVYALKDANGYDTNYIRLRDLADLLKATDAKFDVTWNAQDGIVCTSKHAYDHPNGTEGKIPFTGDQPYAAYLNDTTVDGVQQPLTAFIITYQGGGHTYYQLRDLGKALGFNVGWTSERGMFVQTDRAYTDAD